MSDPSAAGRQEQSARRQHSTVSSVDRNSGRFRRQSRLLKHADFDRVYRNGRRQFAGKMTFFYLPREVDPEDLPAVARVGLTVGRAMGGAVARNRLKRRMREAVRFSLRDLPLAVDVVINPKRSAVDAEFSELRAEVEQGFRAIAQRLKPRSTRREPSARQTEKKQP